jgi:hypothetical protein
MGIYAYKVTAQTVTLENGEKAHIALFAYKLSSRDKENQKAYFTSGAARCDKSAEQGKRGCWIVKGHHDKENQRLEIVRMAFKAQQPLGGFVETFPYVDSCPVSQTVTLPRGVCFSKVE